MGYLLPLFTKVNNNFVKHIVGRGVIILVMPSFSEKNLKFLLKFGGGVGQVNR